MAWLKPLHFVLVFVLCFEQCFGNQLYFIEQQAFGSNFASGATIADFDLDGDLDIIMCSNARYMNTSQKDLTTVWINNGKGIMSKHSTPIFDNTGTGKGIASGDINNDGLIDVYFCFLGAFLNQGDFNFTFVNATYAVDTEVCILKDFNNDGYLDVLLVSLAPQTVLLYGQGNGTFTDSHNIRLGAPDDRDYVEAAVFDFNSDDFLDVLIADYINGSFIEINPGTSYDNFTTLLNNLSSTYPLLPPASSVQIGDLNNDDIIDAVFSLFSGQISVWFGIGGGLFNDSGQHLGEASDWTSDIVLGDFDNDGDLDIFAGNSQDPGNQGIGKPNKLFLNDGTGIFTQDSSVYGNWSSYSVFVADFDNNSLLDVFVLNIFNQVSRLYKNIYDNPSYGSAVPGENTNVTSEDFYLEFNGTSPNYVVVPKDKCGNIKLGSGVRFQFDKIREIDANNTISEISFPESYFMSKNPHVGSVGFDWSTANSSAGSLAISLGFTYFNDTVSMSFGHQSFKVDPKTNKWTIKLDYWPFENNTNLLQIDVLVLGSFLNQLTALKVVNVTQTQTPDDMTQVVIHTEDKLQIVMTFLNFVLIDGVSTRDMLVEGINNWTVIRFTFPFFSYHLEYDPNFSVIFTGGNSNSGPSVDGSNGGYYDFCGVYHPAPSQSEDSSTHSSAWVAAVVIPVVVGVFLIVVVSGIIGVVFFIKSKKQDSY